MDDVPLVQFVEQHDGNLGDCTVAAFAMCLGLTYSQALVAIAALVPDVLKTGANWPELKAVARTLGVALKKKKEFDLDDLEEGSGILGVEFPDGVQHAVFFKRGLIFDGETKGVWDADVYIHVEKVRVLSMLVNAGKVKGKRRGKR